MVVLQIQCKKEVRKDAYQKISAVQCIQDTKNPYFVPNAILTQSFRPPSVGYAVASSAHISACGTKNISINMIHIGIAPNPRPKLSEVDFAIQRIP